MTYLFLDDMRMPTEVVGYDNIDWHIVRSYAEFESYINNYGMPDVISFDHDLVDAHYDVDWVEVYYEKTEPVPVQPTGLDCLKFLINRLIMNKPSTTSEWPMCAAHSTNPVGRYEIDKLLETWSFPRFAPDI